MICSGVAVLGRPSCGPKTAIPPRSGIFRRLVRPDLKRAAQHFIVEREGDASVYTFKNCKGNSVGL